MLGINQTVGNKKQKFDFNFLYFNLFFNSFVFTSKRYEKDPWVINILVKEVIEEWMEKAKGRGRPRVMLLETTKPMRLMKIWG